MFCKSMSFHRFLLISALTAGCAAAAFAQESTLAATPATTISRPYVFPPVTLTSTETARVIVVNTAAPATGNNTAPSCTGSVTFLSSGTTPTVGSLPFTLGAGKFGFFDLPYAKSGLSTIPGAIVGQVSETFTLGQAQAPCSLGLSLVVFDTVTGVAHVVLGNASAQAIVSPLPFANFR